MYCIFESSDLFLLQELKECSGHVFVDSVPEFCLPEVSLFQHITQTSDYFVWEEFANLLLLLADSC